MAPVASVCAMNGSPLVSVEIPSPNFTQPAGQRRVALVVLHTTETHEDHGRAAAVARNWFARHDARVSSHYVVDDAAIAQSVDEDAIAWAAPGANRNGIQVELVGRAGQGASGWGDDYSVATLNNAARLVADICTRHALRTVALNSLDLKPKSWFPHGMGLIGGITTHAAVSAAFGKSDHWDPGPSFPMTWFLERVRYHQVRG